MLDINPSFASYFFRNGVCDKITLLAQNPENVEVTEQAIKVIEKLSYENPKGLLESNAFGAVLYLIEYFELTTRKQILSACFNMAHCCSSPTVIADKIMPSFSLLTNLLNFLGDSEVERSIKELIFALFASVLSSTKYKAGDAVQSIIDEVTSSDMSVFLIRNVEDLTEIVDNEAYFKSNMKIIINSITSLSILVQKHPDTLKAVMQSKIFMTINKIIMSKLNDDTMTTLQTAMLKLLQSLMSGTYTIFDFPSDQVEYFSTHILPYLVENGFLILTPSTFKSTLNLLDIFANAASDEMLLKSLNADSVAKLCTKSIDSRNVDYIKPVISIVRNMLKKGEQKYRQAFVKNGVLAKLHEAKEMKDLKVSSAVDFMPVISKKIGRYNDDPLEQVTESLYSENAEVRPEEMIKEGKEILNMLKTETIKLKDMEQEEEFEKMVMQIKQKVKAIGSPKKLNKNETIESVKLEIEDLLNTEFKDTPEVNKTLDELSANFDIKAFHHVLMNDQIACFEMNHFKLIEKLSSFLEPKLENSPLTEFEIERTLPIFMEVFSSESVSQLVGLINDVLITMNCFPVNINENSLKISGGNIGLQPIRVQVMLKYEQIETLGEEAAETVSMLDNYNKIQNYILITEATCLSDLQLGVSNLDADTLCKPVNKQNQCLSELGISAIPEDFETNFYVKLDKLYKLKPNETVLTFLKKVAALNTSFGKKPVINFEIKLKEKEQTVEEEEPKSDFLHHYSKLVNNDKIKALPQITCHLHLLGLFNLINTRFNQLYNFQPILENKKITNFIIRQCCDETNISNNNLPLWCSAISALLPEIASFDSRYLLLKVSSFTHVRNVYNLLFYLKNTKNIKFNENLLKRTKIEVDREFIVNSVSMLKEKKNLKDLILEFTFINEPGSGLGPTLEWYCLASKELLKTKYWLMTQNNTFFPKVLLNDEQTEIFENTGFLIARAIYDDKIIDVPISEKFWDLVLGRVTL